MKYDLDKGFFVQHCFHHYVHLCMFVVFTTVHVRRLEKVAIPILQTKYDSMIYACSNYSSFVSIVTGDACCPRRQHATLSDAHGAPRCMTDIRITFSPTNWSLTNLSSILVVSTEKRRNPARHKWRPHMPK